MTTVKSRGSYIREHCSVVKQTAADILCAHCGSECSTTHVVSNELDFCCRGCSTVHQILKENGLDRYYELAERPGISLNRRSRSDYSYLEDPAVAAQFIEFEDQTQARVRFEVPAIHCSSCIWLLENLNRLHPGILLVRVHFLEKYASIRFDKELISLREIAELLESIGYEPNISLKSGSKEERKHADHKLSLRIAVAGFCFGNAMLFSFPEYLGMNALNGGAFKPLFSWLNFGLAIPALLYSGSEYLTSAYRALRKKVLHINVPLAIGMIALFLRSGYEIISETGPGYFDSLTGLIFFLLVGKWFQERTYAHISFDRDYRSYFPLAVHVLESGTERVKLLSDLAVGDRLRIRNGELIPADGILLNGRASIDYSFVTGESIPVSKELGEMVYAGGKQCGERIEMEITKEVSQGKLTRLWNEYGIQEKETALHSFTDKVSKYFTIGLLTIAALTLIFWSFSSVSTGFFAFTSVLIVACPCALALSSPFALSNTMRILGKHEFYLRNSRAVESLAGVDRVVFDKTGTLTLASEFEIEYRGDDLSTSELQLLRSMLAQSNHPLSRSLYLHLENYSTVEIETFREIAGLGLEASAGELSMRVGSGTFVGSGTAKLKQTHVGISVNGVFKGYFLLKNKYRSGLRAVLSRLKEQGFRLGLLSGDGEGEKNRVRTLFPEIEDLFFGKDPVEKLELVENYRRQGDKVLMLGDGLNDAGALAVSDVGVVLTESVNNFTPAAKGILKASKLEELPSFIRLSKATMRVIYISFGISIIYNIAGLSFAVQGMLSPVLAAVLMPLSSISVVVFNTVATNYLARREGLK